jgi:hypothetical protein
MTTWLPALDFPEGRAYDTVHEGTTWRIALVLHGRPTGFDWFDKEPADGWRLFRRESGSRMQPIAAPGRDISFVQEVAARRIYGS